MEDARSNWHRVVEFRARTSAINFSAVSLAEDEERRGGVGGFADQHSAIPRRSRLLAGRLHRVVYDSRDQSAKPARLFTERVISPPAPPLITSAADALAVVLNERGRVDVDHIAELLHRDHEDVVAELGSAIFRDPSDGSWQTADAYLSGPVRDRLKVAEAAAALDPAFERNVTALQGVQPADLQPSDITRTRRTLDSRPTISRLRQGDDGSRNLDPPHAGFGFVDRGGPPLGWMAAGTWNGARIAAIAGEHSPCVNWHPANLRHLLGRDSDRRCSTSSIRRRPTKLQRSRTPSIVDLVRA